MGQYPLAPFLQRLVGGGRAGEESQHAPTWALAWRSSGPGSGAAVAASLAAAALWTETNGSLVCPGSFNGIVALKPTVGLVSRTHIVPISHSQDTAGPMTRSVADAALLLTVMAGRDDGDPATAEADAHSQDYAAPLAAASLKGKRLGVVVPADNSDIWALFAGAQKTLAAAGAEIVPIPEFAPSAERTADENLVLEFELKHDLNAYLASLPSGQPRSLAELIAFDRATPRELMLFGQERVFEAAAVRRRSVRSCLSGSAGAAAKRDAGHAGPKPGALSPRCPDPALSTEPSFRIDLVRGDVPSGGSAAGIPAMAGYPHTSSADAALSEGPAEQAAPYMQVGPRWSEAALLALGKAAEKALPPRQPHRVLAFGAIAGSRPALDPVMARRRSCSAQSRRSGRPLFEIASVRIVWRRLPPSENQQENGKNRHGPTAFAAWSFGAGDSRQPDS